MRIFPLLHADAPMFQLGMRPFYLLGAAFAALAVPAWLGAYLGAWPGTHFGLAWHAHEMVFGFATAIVAGFLLTALRNWTGLPTPQGARLRALALLWVAGRAAALAPPVVFALVDGAFLFVLAFIVLQVLLLADNQRNLPVFVVVMLLAACNASFHLASLGVDVLSPLVPVRAAILAMVVLIGLIGGRVAPMFTRNGAPGSRPRQFGALDMACALALGAAILCYMSSVPALLTAALCWLAAALHGVRFLLWDPLATLRHPLLWSFHLSYALLVAGLALLGFHALGMAGASSVFHLLGAGAIGGMIGAMVTRTALGHTGRPLRAGALETTVYALLPAGALARLGANLAPHAARMPLLLLAAACWSLAFLLYLYRYTPYLTRPRADDPAMRQPASTSR